MSARLPRAPRPSLYQRACSLYNRLPAWALVLLLLGLWYVGVVLPGVREAAR